MDSNKTGLALGALMSLAHLVWAVVVALGIAQGYMDWIYSIHFLNNPFIVGTFDITTATILVVVTGVVGYILGFIFALIWNKVQK